MSCNLRLLLFLKNKPNLYGCSFKSELNIIAQCIFFNSVSDLFICFKPRHNYIHSLNVKLQHQKGMYVGK